MLDYCRRKDTDIHFAGDYFCEIGNMETACGTGHEAAKRARVRLDAPRSQARGSLERYPI